MKTLSECRDEFKDVMREPMRKEWDRRCSQAGRLRTTDEREGFRAVLLNQTGILMDVLLCLMGKDPKAASDARSVLSELVDELPTIEQAN